MRELTSNEKLKVKRWVKGLGMQRMARKYQWSNEQLALNIEKYLRSGTKNSIAEYMDQLAASQMPNTENQLAC